MPTERMFLTPRAAMLRRLVKSVPNPRRRLRRFWAVAGAAAVVLAYSLLRLWSGF